MSAPGEIRPDPRGPASAAGRIHAGLRLAIGVVCVLMLTVMMFLTALDVAGRYLANRPILGASEVTEILLVLVIYIGFIAVCLERSHVTVDLVIDRFPRRFQPVRRALVTLVSAGLMAVIAWRLWVYGQQFASYGGTTNSIRIPLAPVVWTCAAAVAISAVLTLAGLFLRDGEQEG